MTDQRTAHDEPEPGPDFHIPGESDIKSWVGDVIKGPFSAVEKAIGTVKTDVEHASTGIEGVAKTLAPDALKTLLTWQEKQISAAVDNVDKLEWVAEDVTREFKALAGSVTKKTKPELGVFTDLEDLIIELVDDFEALCDEFGITALPLPSDKEISGALDKMGGFANALIDDLPGHDHLTSLVSQLKSGSFSLPTGDTISGGLGGAVCYANGALKEVKESFWRRSGTSWRACPARSTRMEPVPSPALRPRAI